uniref:Uncharacterized protein n=1 Tax=Erpetoichthys calabaricus TaxID=27687 RepID=A0A8C4XHC5_ERPCA
MKRNFSLKYLNHIYKCLGASVPRPAKLFHASKRTDCKIICQTNRRTFYRMVPEYHKITTTKRTPELNHTSVTPISTNTVHHELLKVGIYDRAVIGKLLTLLTWGKEHNTCTPDSGPGGPQVAAGFHSNPFPNQRAVFTAN